MIIGKPESYVVVHVVPDQVIIREDRYSPEICSPISVLIVQGWTQAVAQKPLASVVAVGGVGTGQPLSVLVQPTFSSQGITE